MIKNNKIKRKIMKNKSIKGISLTLAAISLAGLVGCSGGGESNGGGSSGGTSAKSTRDTSVNVASTLVDFSEYSDTKVADIYAWRGPTDLSEKQWKALKDSGINTIILDSGLGGSTNSSRFGNPEQEDYIEKCMEYGIKAIGYTASKTTFTKSVKDYSKSELYDTIAGIDYSDEPSMEYFSNIAEVIPDFASKYPNGKFFVCLNSSGAESKYLGTPSYEEYITSWYDTVLSQLPEGMPRVLITDVYPCCNTANKTDYNHITDGWLISCAYFAEMKKAHPELILHMAMQSLSFGDLDRQGRTWREPSEADCLFQSYVNMAFGFTEFSWFTFSTPDYTIEFKEDNKAILDREGNTTSIFEAVKSANDLIYSLDEVMQSVTFQGVYPVYVKRDDATSDHYIKLAIDKLKTREKVALDIKADCNVLSGVTTDTSVILSQFIDENNNECFMLVNYSDPTENLTANVTLDLIDCDKAIVYRNGKAVTVDVTGGKLTEKLPAGQGVFVIPYKA